MRNRKLIRARWALALWLFIGAACLWFVTMAAMTWITADTMDRYLEKENGEIAWNVINAAQLQRLADEKDIQHETRDYWIWNGANTSWLDNRFDGGLLRYTEREPQTAVVIYDGDGNLLDSSCNSLYAYYMTEETWHTGKTDMEYDGVLRVLYDPSELTETALLTIRRKDWIVMRFIGTLDDGYLTPSKMEYIDYDHYRDLLFNKYGSGSYERHQRIQEMVELHGLQWQTLLESSCDEPGQQIFYSLNAHASYYDWGNTVTVGERQYENLLSYLMQLEDTVDINDYYKQHQGNLWETVLTDIQAVYTRVDGDYVRAYEVRAAVRYSPWKNAMDALLYVYIGSLLILLLQAYCLWRLLLEKLVIPLETFDDAASRNWKPMYYKKYHLPKWREVEQLCHHYDHIRISRERQKDDLARLTKSLVYAKEAETNRRLMTSAVAHELKTPLAVIHSYAEGLKEHIAEEKRDQYLDVILSETDQLDSLVLEMLDLSRLEAGKVRLSREMCSLSELVQTVFRKMDCLVDEKSLQLEIKLTSPCDVSVDEGRISQVVENFASNAIRYTPNGGRITVKTFEDRRFVWCRVENESKPFMQEELSKIWNTFYQSDQARSGKGTGLGLAICKNIIDLHGGICQAENTSDGVAFWFRLNK